MKVGDLIARLQQFDPGMTVVAQSMFHSEHYTEKIDHPHILELARKDWGFLSSRWANEASAEKERVVVL